MNLNRRPGGQPVMTIQSLYNSQFGEARWDETSSFYSLGGTPGESLELRRGLERLVPDLPEDWQSLSVGSLVASAKAHSRAASKARIPSNIDTLRGFACLLVVAYHVIGPDSSSGLRAPAGSAWHYAVDSFQFVRMPLFTALSGLLYAAISANRDSFATFVKHKARRILVPLISATVVVWSLRTITYGGRTSLFDAFLYGYEHLWYLDAVMMMFVIVGFADRHIGQAWQGWTAAMLALICFRSYIPIVHIFAFSNMLNLLPFFMFGMLIFRTPLIFRGRFSFEVAVCIAAVLIVLQQANMFKAVSFQWDFSWIEYAGSFGILVVLIRVAPKWVLLERLSAYSFTIYLWHPAFNAGSRMLLNAVGVTQHAIVFVVGMIVAIMLPIALHLFVVRFPRLSLPLIGQ